MIAALVLKLLTSNIMPVILPPLVAWVRKFIEDHIPAPLIPVMLALGGAAVTSLSAMLGVAPPQDLTTLGAEAWDGALLGLATVGVHQLYKHGRDWIRSLKKGD